MMGTRRFVCPRGTFQAAYLETYSSGALDRKIREAREMLRSCTVCPRECGCNRLQDEVGVCASGRHASVASFSPHFGEELPLRGTHGSGTMFFSHCNLMCVFCQNHDISTNDRRAFFPTSAPDELAATMIALQGMGCHNINLVTPEHVVPQILEAVPLAIEGGLHVPLVYNTGSYDSLHSIRLMEGVVDVYMPDFKMWDPDRSRRFLKAEDYPKTARAAITEMHRQVGDLMVDEEGIALRGLLIRHLVMPSMLDDTASILVWLANDLSRNSYVNLMGQYYPARHVNALRYPEINRRPTRGELSKARFLAMEAGLWRFD